MKIIKHTDSRLILCQRASWPMKLLLSLSFLPFAAPLVLIITMAIALTGVKELSCQRTEPEKIRCIYRESKLLGLLPLKPQLFDQVQQVQLRQDTSFESTEEDEGYYNLDFISERGVLKSSLVSGSNGGKARRYFNQINEFIKSDRTSLSIKDDQRLDGTLILSVFVCGIPLSVISLIAYGVLFYRRKIMFDKISRQIFLEHGIGRYNRSVIIPISEIRGFAIVCETKPDSKTSYCLNSVPQSTDLHCIVSSADLRQVEAMRATIQSFLDSTNEG